MTTAAQTLCATGRLTGAQEKLAVEIESASARLNRVVESLLSAARMRSGQLKPKMDWCDVSDLVRVALRNVRIWLDGRPIQNRVNPGLPLVKADFVLLEQALKNLLLNAAMHTPAGTPVEVGAWVEEKQLVIEVADRGPGLPAGGSVQIFEIFHRSPNAKPGGMGLGLAIVKGFVEAQGGMIIAANRSGGGAAFRISLPEIETPKLMEENV
jgi:two-component system sensor histidine kinase KdpD